MENAVVHGKRFSKLVIDWQDEQTREEVMRFSQKWLSSRNFLTSRMNGLSYVGESSLAITPAEEGDEVDNKAHLSKVGASEISWVDSFMANHKIPCQKAHRVGDDTLDY